MKRDLTTDWLINSRRPMGAYSTFSSTRVGLGGPARHRAYTVPHVSDAPLGHPGQQDLNILARGAVIGDT